MTKIYTKEVDRCCHCPNRVSVFGSVCSLKVKDLDTNALFYQIPSWCPLPNSELSPNNEAHQIKNILDKHFKN